jgi:hypothetical protein
MDYHGDLGPRLDWSFLLTQHGFICGCMLIVPGCCMDSHRFIDKFMDQHRFMLMLVSKGSCCMDVNDFLRFMLTLYVS